MNNKIKVFEMMDLVQSVQLKKMERFYFAEQMLQKPLDI